jgi:uncharacterized lipoprotein NlpE involved in copper resistance
MNKAIITVIVVYLILIFCSNMITSNKQLDDMDKQRMIELVMERCEGTVTVNERHLGGEKHFVASCKVIE